MTAPSTPPISPRRLEEAAFNAWPALQTVLVDGWVLRFAGGYTKRANSVNPTYPSADPDIAATMDRCERLFSSRGLPSIVRLTSFGAPEGLDELLAGRGYRHADRSIVMMRGREDAIPPLAGGLELQSLDPDTWLTLYESFSGAPAARRDTHRQMLGQITGDALYAVLVDLDLGRPVACGLCVAENDLAGLFEIATDPALRRRGFGRALVEAMIGWTHDRGVATTYLQVVATNDPAIRLYERLGFREVYRYWYRIPVS